MEGHGSMEVTFQTFSADSCDSSSNCLGEDVISICRPWLHSCICPGSVSVLDRSSVLDHASILHRADYGKEKRREDEMAVASKRKKREHDVMVVA